MCHVIATQTYRISPPPGCDDLFILLPAMRDAAGGSGCLSVAQVVVHLVVQVDDVGSRNAGAFQVHCSFEPKPGREQATTLAKWMEGLWHTTLLPVIVM